MIQTKKLRMRAQGNGRPCQYPSEYETKIMYESTRMLATLPITLGIRTKNTY